MYPAAIMDLIRTQTGFKTWKELGGLNADEAALLIRKLMEGAAANDRGSKRSGNAIILKDVVKIRTFLDTNKANLMPRDRRLSSGRRTVLSDSDDDEIEAVDGGMKGGHAAAAGSARTPATAVVISSDSDHSNSNAEEEKRLARGSSSATVCASSSQGGGGRMGIAGGGGATSASEDLALSESLLPVSSVAATTDSEEEWAQKHRAKRRKRKQNAAAARGRASPDGFGAPKGVFPDELEDDYEGGFFGAHNPKPLGLEQSFTTVLQMMVSGALDPDCFEAFADDPQYTEARKTVSNALNDRQQYCVASAVWSPAFKEQLSWYPTSAVQSARAKKSNGECEACRRKNHAASKIVCLEGAAYDRFDFSPLSYRPRNRDSPADDKDEEEDGMNGLGDGEDEFEEHAKQPARQVELRVGPTCADRIRVYHALEHFQHNLHRKCVKKTAYMKTDDGKTEADIVHSLMQNDAWCNQKFRDLEEVLDAADKFRSTK
jgi:hypothetical protein